MLHDSEMRKLLDKCGNDRDNNQRWRDHACRGGNAAENAVRLVADERGRVHRDNARGALTDGVVVHQLVLSRPAAIFNDLALQNRQHGIAAAERAYANPCKREV